MQPRLQILAISFSLALFLAVLELIRKGTLQARYALIWLGSALVIFLLSVFKGSLEIVAGLFQVDYAPSLIFAVGLGLMILILLHKTIAISELTLNTRDLAQKVAILDHLIHEHLQTHRSSEASLPKTKPMNIIEHINKGNGTHAETEDFRHRS